MHTEATQQNAFRALADPTRREILLILREQEQPIGNLVNRFDITRAAVKKHLTILEQGNLISVHQRGRERINRLEPRGLKSVTEWLGFFDRFWDDRLKGLKTAIENDSNSKKEN